ncbi:MAG: hypothetical protein ABIQ93_05395, partial [Saprospiraceae bacterium]
MASTNFFRHYIHCLSTALALGLAMISAQAQPTATYTIEANSVYDGSKVILRWAPKDFATWNWANFHNGYDVERTTLTLNGTPLTGEEMTASKLTVATSLKPLPEAQWETMPDTNMAGIVAGSIYGDSIEVVDMAHADFMTVVNTNEARQNRFGFSLFACDQNFDVALAAGLAFLDASVASNSEYVYIIKLNTLPTGTTQKKGVAIITTTAENLPAVAKPVAQGADKAVLLSWPKQAAYSSYVVERSNNGGQNFTVLNNAPFVSLSTLGSDQQISTYLDSLPANEVYYVYRVRGMTPFGISGPVSEAVQGAGITPTLATSPHISSVLEQSTQMQVTWEFPSNMENQISRFEIHRAASIDGNYESQSAVPPNVRVWNDPNPLSSNYYIVKAQDLNGKYAVSLPRFGQLKDEQPPNAPTGLSGSCDALGTVTISWLPGTAADLKGYRVYTSDQNVIDSAFVQITQQPITDTFFRYSVNLSSLTEQMFFAVKAVDFRENNSPLSAHLNIQRADQVAPSAPSITAVLPRSEAVQINILKSFSNDVVRYEIQKRWEGSPDWVTLANFPLANMVPSYTDSLTYLDQVLRRRWYFYRVVAYDDANLPASSQMVRTKPQDQGMRGAIQNLTATLLNGPPKQVQLVWNYPQDVDLVGFQIYRGIDNSQMRSFKFVSASPSTGTGTYAYLDTDT